jgi:hypothetical protein
VRWPNLVRLTCFDPCRSWFLSSPPDLAGLSLFRISFSSRSFFPSISAWPRPNLSHSDFVLPSTLVVQRRSRSGLLAAIFFLGPRTGVRFSASGCHSCVARPRCPVKSASMSRSPMMSARAWSLQPCFLFWSGSSAPGASSARLRFSLAADAAIFALTPVAGYKSHPCGFLRPGFCKSFILSCLSTGVFAAASFCLGIVVVKRINFLV